MVSAPMFVGREAEVAAVMRALADPPASVLVEGDAGIGKTRLVQECLAARSLRGRRVMTAVCPPLREPYPLGPAAMRKLGVTSHTALAMAAADAGLLAAGPDRP